MRVYEMIISGFGGQGILFMGQVLAHAANDIGRNVSWLPSYGPEMRGGTANCMLCISNEAINSPLVLRPNILVAMNKPSLLRFSVTAGSRWVVDCQRRHGRC
jgi:2-oxoglutarate ferredoxin oxidoreductase subunit gamma